MTPVAERMREIGALSAAARGRRGEVRRQLRSGELPLGEAMASPPEPLLDAALIDVIRWSRSNRSHGSRRSLEVIGRAALRDNVNLMMPLGRASERSRTWVAEHGGLWWRSTS